MLSSFFRFAISHVHFNSALVSCVRWFSMYNSVPPIEDSLEKYSQQQFYNLMS